MVDKGFLCDITVQSSPEVVIAELFQPFTLHEGLYRHKVDLQGCINCTEFGWLKYFVGWIGL